MWEDDLKLEELLNTVDLLCTPMEIEKYMPPVSEASEYSREELEHMGFNEAQMEEIELGKRQLLPVGLYAKTGYNWQQMKEIRTGLLECLDVSLYADELYSAEQMREIRKGLLDGIDVSVYATLMLSAKDMELVRKRLLGEAYQHNPSGYAKEVTDESSGIRIRLSDDCMQAFITLPPKSRFSASELERILKRNDISYGILKKELKKAAQGNAGAEELLVASGLPAKTGKDGRYEYFFEVSNESPVIRENGSADYKRIIEAEKKQKGDVLARYYPAGKGTDGETVTGIRIDGQNGAEKRGLYGQGIFYDAKKKVYKANTKGYVAFDEEEGTLNVWDIYVVDGDINRYNGNISYDGMIHVRGSISDMAQIEATGNVIVDGYVESAFIKAGGSIFLQSGMNGCGKGILEAGGKVSGQFFEAVNIYAKGNVEGNYFLNCNVVTDRSLIARDEKAKIIGGSIKAGYSVETYDVSTSGKMMTAIDAGDSVWLIKRLREKEEKLSKTESELKQLTEGRDKLIATYGEKAETKHSLFGQICIAVRMKEEEKESLKGEIAYYEQLVKKAKNAYIRVLGSIQTGVILSVCGKARKIEKDLYGAVTFRTEVS